MARNTEKKAYYTPGFVRGSQTLKDLQADAQERGHSISSVIEERIAQFYEARRQGVALHPSAPLETKKEEEQQGEDPTLQRVRKKRSAARNW